jgi:hypothetical protein
MRGWVREARVGAAREFGARHYRGFAAAEVLGTLARVIGRVLLPLGVAGVAVWLAVRGAASMPAAGRWVLFAVLAGVVLTVAARLRLLGPAAGLALVAGLGWVVWRAVTAWSVPWVWVVGGVAAVVLFARLAGGWRLRLWLATFGR